LRPEDIIHFEVRDFRTIIMTFLKKADIEIDIKDAELFELMKLAHKRDITLNYLIKDVLQAKMNKLELEYLRPSSKLD